MLEGIIREGIGKKATKALRRDGYLIANIYGKGLENINAAFKMGEYLRAVRSKETIAFDVKVGDKEMKVVVQDYQVHPITDVLLHVDLLVAQPNVETVYRVPVRANGIAKGIKDKGVLMVSKRRVPIKSTIENLPNFIDIDVTPLGVSDSILVRDLPENKTLDIRLSDRVAILSVIKAK
jgi:large subunit ribosomal protein L25